MGKTSLLVQFDTGKFQTGTFSATVGIGFTVSTSQPSTSGMVSTRLVPAEMVTSLEVSGSSNSNSSLKTIALIAFD